MNPTTVSIAIYGALAAMHFASCCAIVYRVMFIDRSIGVCTSQVFRVLLAELHASGTWRNIAEHARVRLDVSWLDDVLQTDSPSLAAAAADDVAQRTDRYINILQLVSNCSTMLGLLGTVAGFLVAPTMNSVGLNIAFQTTFAGIVVGLPAIVYVGLTQSRRDAALQQIDEFLSALSHQLQSERIPATQQSLSRPPVQSSTSSATHLTLQAKPTQSRKPPERKSAAASLAPTAHAAAINEIVNDQPVVEGGIA